MSAFSESLKKYVGMRSETEIACDPVEQGAVRRYAQAIMYDDPIFAKPCPNNERYGGPVAPPLFPTHLFRRPMGTEDPIQANARNQESVSYTNLTLPTKRKGYSTCVSGSVLK